MKAQENNPDEEQKQQQCPLTPNGNAKSGSPLYMKKKVIVRSGSIKKSSPENNNFNNNSFQCLLEEQAKENNNNNNISNDLVNQFLPEEDIINGSSFDLNDFTGNHIHLPVPVLHLIKDLTMNDLFNDRIISLVKPKRIRKKKGKILFNFYRNELYNYPFVYYYSLDQIVQMLNDSQKLYNLRTVIMNNRPRASFREINTNIDESNYPKTCTPNKQNISMSSKNVSNFRMSFTPGMDIKNSLINSSTNVVPVHAKTSSLSFYQSDQNLITLGEQHPPLTSTNTVSNFNKKQKLQKYKTISSKETDMITSNLNSTNILTTNTNFNVPVQRTYTEKQTPLLNSSSMTSLFLTKIPKKREDETNLQIDIAYSKAKDAARVVRRLEYSYNMKLSLMYSKPIHKKSAKIIQAWWRYTAFHNKNKFSLIKIQKVFRGYISRKAFEHTLYIYHKMLPFLSTVDKIISRKICELVFDKLVLRYAALKIFHIIKPKASNIIQHMRRYSKEQKFNRFCKIFSKQYMKRCTYTKINLDNETMKKLTKIQATMKTHLMHTNDKIMLKYGRDYHPYLYYKLKYKTSLYKKKIVSFRKCCQKVKELHLKANKNVNNKYEYLPYVLKKIFWNRFKSYYKDVFEEKDEKILQKRAVRGVLKKKIVKDNKNDIRKYFDRWRMYNMAYERYIRPSICDKLKYIDLVMKYHKKVDEKIFMLKLEGNKEQKEENENRAMKKLVEIYHTRNCDEYYTNVLNKYFQRWKKQNMEHKLLKSKRTLNRFCKKSIEKLNNNKKNKLREMLNIRNSYLRDCLKSWKFENIKFKIVSKRFFKNERKNVLDSKRKASLLKNINQLEKRKQLYKKASFKKYKINTGMNYRKCILSNIQVSFFHKKRKFFSLRKYRMLKYMINKLNNIKRIDHWDEIIHKKFLFWKSFGKYSQFNGILRKRIISLHNTNVSFIRAKYYEWKRKVMMERFIIMIIYLQIKIKTFLRRIKAKK